MYEADQWENVLQTRMREKLLTPIHNAYSVASTTMAITTIQSAR